MKKLKVFLLICLACALTAAVVFAAVNIYVIAYAGKYIITPDETAILENTDCIIVLGARVKADGSPSLILESRLDMGLLLYKNGVSGKILMSGDHGRGEYDEVNNMMNYALENSDIDKESIFLDHAGFSTYESAYRAKEIFRINKGVIVTQKYHLYRAVYTARKNGIEAYGVPCDDYGWPRMAYYKFRESLAIFKDFWKCVFNVSPTYLGDTIPVSGSALETHDKKD